MAASSWKQRQRLERHLGGELGAVADVPEAVRLAHLAVAGQVAARLAHQPHRRPITGSPFSAARKRFRRGSMCGWLRVRKMRPSLPARVTALSLGPSQLSFGDPRGARRESSSRAGALHDLGGDPAAAEAKALVRALKARGVTAMALPCIERQKVSFPEWPGTLRGVPFVFVTSPLRRSACRGGGCAACGWRRCGPRARGAGGEGRGVRGDGEGRGGGAGEGARAARARGGEVRARSTCSTRRAIWAAASRSSGGRGRCSRRSGG